MIRRIIAVFALLALSASAVYAAKDCCPGDCCGKACCQKHKK